MKKVAVKVPPNTAAARTKVLIFGYKEFSQLMSSVLPKFSDRAEFKIVDAIVGSVSEIEQHINNYHPDVVVSAGSNAAYLASSLSMPVQSLHTTEGDVIAALTRAARVSNNIVLVNFNGPSECVPLIEKSYDVSVTEHVYRTADEAREWFHVHRNDPDVVYVGASLVCGLAAYYQLPSFLLYSVASCEQTLKLALEKGEAYREHRQQQVLTKWLLTQSKTPIIMVDHIDNQVVYNEAAKTQLHLSTDYLSDLAPFLAMIKSNRESDGACEINELKWWFHHDDVHSHQRHCDVYQFYPKKSAHSQHGQLLQPANHNIVFQSNAMAEVLADIGAYALSPSNVLIFGESGTGKELIARAIHAKSPYSTGHFVALNCSAIPSELFEGELFGHVDGAYTGSKRGGRKGLIEEAEGGLLFLDEISELALDQQTKLLRFLQERRYRPLGGNQERNANLKLVAATNKPLRQLVKQGLFREDLYFRLNVFNVDVPPLRARQEDILLIAESKLRALITQYKLAFGEKDIIGPIAIYLCSYRWPGNIRELENVLERIVAWLYATQDLNGLDHAIGRIAHELFTQEVASNEQSEQVLKNTEESLIRAAMQRFNGNKKLVAEYLGMSQTTLWRRLKAFENT